MHKRQKMATSHGIVKSSWRSLENKYFERAWYDMKWFEWYDMLSRRSSRRSKSGLVKAEFRRLSGLLGIYQKINAYKWLKGNSEGILGFWAFISKDQCIQMTNQYYVSSFFSPPGRCDLLLSNIEDHQYLIFPIFVCSLPKSKWFAIENFAFDIFV